MLFCFQNKDMSVYYTLESEQADFTSSIVMNMGVCYMTKKIVNLVRCIILHVLSAATSVPKERYSQKEEAKAMTALKRFCKLVEISKVAAPDSASQREYHGFIMDLYSVSLCLESKQYCMACILLHDLIKWNARWNTLQVSKRIVQEAISFEPK